MKVLHVITTLTKGGAESHLISLVHKQMDSGIQVKVAYLKEAPYWQPALEKLGVEVIALGLRWYGDFGPVFKLAAYLRTWKPDILHAHMPPAEVYSILARSITSYKPTYIISKHNDERFASFPCAEKIAAYSATKAPRIIAISSAVKKFFDKRGEPFSGKLDVIPYGIDSAPFIQRSRKETDNLRSEWQISPECLVIGAVCRWVPQKALPTLIHGFGKYLKRESKTQARLVLVGRGPLENSLKALVNDLGIGKSVLFAGFREDMPLVMNSIDIFAMTSEYEGFGLVLLEAMAAKLPIIATKVSAIPEIVIHGETGLLVEKGDSEGVAVAIETMEDAEFRRRLGNSGHHRCQEVFSLEKMHLATLQLYREALAYQQKPLKSNSDLGK